MTVFEGRIITADENNDIYRYLVEDGGIIVYVGNKLPAEYAGCPVKKVAGALMPTFADAHGHFSSYAMLATTLKLDRAQSNDEIVSLIAQRDKELPRGKAMLCFGATPKVREGVLVSREEIDGAVPGRCVVIICGDGHSMVMNSAALAKMPASVLAMNGCDREHGWFMHESFMKGVDKLLRIIKPLDALQAFQDALDVYSDSGFGLVCCESGTGFPLDLDVELEKWLYRGQKSGLQMRIFIQSFDVKKALRRHIPRLGGCFACALDGSITSADAAFSEPYNGTDNTGILYYTDDDLYEKIKKIHLAGLAFQMHAIGDRAVSQAARVYKRILDEFPRDDHRHGIIDATLVPEEAMAIIEKYHIQIIGQPIFMKLAAEHPEFMFGRLGEKRAALAEPYNEFLRRSIHFCCSSDCPVSFPDGFSWIDAMVNNPNEAHRVSLDQAIRCCTWAAYYNTFDEKERGSLEPGKTADMMIADRDPYAVDPSELADIKVTDTYYAGRRWQKTDENVLRVIIRGMFTGRDKKL